VPKNHPTMDMKIEATQKMRKKCDTFPEEGVKHVMDKIPANIFKGFGHVQV
jgi:hypothetical protein